jgi:uncharacterized membrane protein
MPIWLPCIAFEILLLNLTAVVKILTWLFWLIATYNNGVVAAISFLITFILGVIELLNKKDSRFRNGKKKRVSFCCLMRFIYL